MEQLNLHKKKLYALALAAVGLIALILPWMSVSYNFGGFGGAVGSQSVNGFRGWGYLSLIGIAVVAVATLMEDKTKDYSDTMKKAATGGFGAMLLGAVIFFIRISSVGGAGFAGVKSGPSFGLFIELAAGLAGAALVWGLVKVPQTPPAPPKS